VAETGENHQCGVNDLGITRDNYQQVEKHTLKHNSVKIEFLFRFSDAEFTVRGQVQSAGQVGKEGYATSLG
jgi:hypothetical protein